MRTSTKAPPTDLDFPSSGTYYVSDERLRAFKALTPEQKLRWVEEVSTFLRLAKISSAQPPEEKTEAERLNTEKS